MEDDTEGKKYTFEQKVVSAVWVHEMSLNNQTWADIQRNFRARFRMPAPKRTTLLNWERKLFTTGNLNDSGRTGRPCARLMHVPYVKASLEESPTLSLRERARSLGLPRSTLLKILKDDLNMAYETGNNNGNTDEPPFKKPKRPCYNVGQWKEKHSNEVKTKCEYIENSDNEAMT